MLQLQTGQRIGPYRIAGFLGRGAFAQVHLAEDARGRQVALKVGDVSGGGKFLPRLKEVSDLRDPRAVSPDEALAEALFLDPADGAHAEVLDAAEVDGLLEREAELLARANGRGTPEFHDLIWPDGRPVIVMEAIRGATLRERIRSLEGVRLAWIATACRTLENLYAQGWTCHGDVKPENLMVAEDGRLLLIDPVPEACRADRIVTTPAYNPFLRWDAKGDAQGLAILTYELLAGGLPFDRAPWPLAGTSLAAHPEEERRLSLSLYLSYPPLREVNALSPAQLCDAIHHALCDPRYGVADLRRDLDAFLMRGAA
jgi:serine/threonine protein kinase